MSMMACTVTGISQDRHTAVGDKDVETETVMGKMCQPIRFWMS